MEGRAGNRERRECKGERVFRIVPVSASDLPNGTDWLWVESPQGDRYLLIDGGKPEGVEVPRPMAAALAAII